MLVDKSEDKQATMKRERRFLCVIQTKTAQRKYKSENGGSECFTTSSIKSLFLFSFSIFFSSAHKILYQQTELQQV